MTGSLKALTGEVKAVVCAVLDMTDEELERYLAENGMCVTVSYTHLGEIVIARGGGDEIVVYSAEV